MLHPQAKAALAEEDGAPPVSDPSVDIDVERRTGRAAAVAGPREDVGEVLDADADGVPVRLYRPRTDHLLLPVIVHLHGGGFVFNDIEVHDAAVRRLVNRSGLAAVSVDYRRPPEHPFPAAPDDVDVVMGWLGRTGAAHGLDTSRLGVHGDSAGGNLALVAALRHPGRLGALALTYPFVDARMRGASYDEAVGLFDRGEAAWYWEQYASSPDDYDDPDFSPIESTRLAVLPPTLVATAEHDPLRDEGELLASRIAEAGVSCVATRYLGMLHGFWRHPEAFDAAEPLTRQIAGFFQSHLLPGGTATVPRQ
ncbi:alpha/beta hydrolase [Nocardioides terrisoli]|uniref:alpha/beta hydrolase n=1 Tax=Nocardioides terrisoli TaxID=3388267 RepID=UPI00287BBB03|nr:alpha/beta hydrolase [Nocardioides marmorisolisilvae]